MHFGSLVAAISSYLDAKFNDGLWLLRVEDLDPPREPAGASELILGQLFKLGLEWDGEVLYQSTRIDAYQSALDELRQKSLTYKCDCTRGFIKSRGSIYDGYCRTREKAIANDFAIRVKTSNAPIKFRDRIKGVFEQNLEKDVGDFVILRKDKLFAYHLASVIDDDFQQITHIVRGSDLIDSTPRQYTCKKYLGLERRIMPISR